MDFGILRGFMSVEDNTQNNLISWGDLDHNTKWVGSGVGFGNQDSSVSAIANGFHEDNFYKTTVLPHHTYNGAQNKFSFSSPNSQYYGAGGQFTPSQWMELQHQALIYKYITANAAIPSNLLIPIRQNSFGLGSLHLGFRNGSDPEPGRCRRTDGKKWRCAKDAVADQKYCERHINRGRHRSRKHVEAQNCRSIGTNAAVTGRKLIAGIPISAVTSQDSRKTNMEGIMLSSSSIPLKKSQVSNWASSNSEFGLDSLLKSDAKSQHLLQLIHSSQTTLATTSNSLDHSHHEIGLGMGKQPNRVPGGPLGEVLQLSTSEI